MNWLMFVPFLFFVQNRKDLVIDKKRITGLVIMAGIILVSGYINADIMSDPANENISSNLYDNFALPSLLLVSSLMIKEVAESKYIKWILLILGLFLFGYMSLHYLIGFHNPYWENLGLTIKDVYGF